MSLATILARVAADTGADIANADQRQYLIDRIQETARTLYNNFDLPGCEREQIIALEDGQQLVTFPWYMKKILRIRDYEWRQPIDLVDMRPRYSTTGWANNNPTSSFWIRYRKVGISGIRYNINGSSKLRFSFAAPVTSAVAITVSGSTDLAGKITETLVFAVGDTSKVTANLFKDIPRNGIIKSSVTTSDLTVTDVDGREVCLIPNNMLTVEHIVVQVQDRWMSTGNNRLIEVMFKAYYEPMVEDSDCFMLGEEYDEAIFYQTMAVLYSKQEDKSDKVAEMGSAAQAILRKISESIQPDESDAMEVGDNPSITTLTRISDRQYWGNSGI